MLTVSTSLLMVAGPPQCNHENQQLYWRGIRCPFLPKLPGNVYSQTPDSDDRDVDSAVTFAKKAFPEWSVLSNDKRSEYLLKIADLIDQNHEELAKAESKDNGKPINLASKVDIPRASANFRFFATTILHF